MPTMGARKFWWDRAQPIDAVVNPLRAVVFDLDALADIERDGNRAAFNAAFAAHGLEIEWGVEKYRRLLRIADEEKRIAVELRRRGFGMASKGLAAEVYSTKTEWYDDCVLDSVVEPRPGIIDLVMSLFVTGVWVGVVSTGRRQLVDPLVRQLAGDGLVETIVTADDVEPGEPKTELYKLALWEFGIAPDCALAVAGSVSGLHAAAASGLPAVAITSEYTDARDFCGAAAVLPRIDGEEPLLAAGCELLHKRSLISRAA
jgi:beta-phosphoglucomutase-like phosphatase (HAD superfamily)